MTLLQLQYFQVLAHVLHYTQAAEKLHISQPSLSYSISELEKELGVNLLEKEKRKIALTEEGELFLPYVERSIQILEEGTEILKQQNGLRPVVRLGYFHSISSTFIPSLVDQFYKVPANRRIQFHFTQDLSFDILNELRNDHLDLAFCMHQSEDTSSVPIMWQQLYLVVPSSHPLARKNSVQFADFAELPLVMLERTSSIRDEVERIWHSHDVTPKIAFEVKGCDAAIQFVSLNFGVSILPMVPAMNSFAVKALSLDEKIFRRMIFLIWSADRILPSAVREVRDFILKNYAINNGKESPD